MKGLSADARRDLPLAAVAAATTWLTMLSWRGFSDLWGQFLGPLIVVAAAVPLAGVLLRAAPVNRRTGAVLHVLVIAVLVWLMLGGSPIHPFSSTHHLANRVADAWTSAETYQPPIPSTVPSIAPLLIPCGALALLVVDLLACWLRRVPLAGLPLLAVYCVPISVIGTGVSWVVFLFAAAGFLMMMYLHESAHITRWGRPLGGTGTEAASDPQGFGVRNGASKASATTVGSAAVVIAVVLPIFVPTLHLDGLGLFGPGGHGNGVKVVNPTASMVRNLHRGKNVPLLDVTTDDPDPSYLRIAVLTQFNGVEWTTGNRSIVSDQTASGLLPYAEQGLSASVPTDPHNYTVKATSDFDSTWLPTQFPVSSVNAVGDWHWDASTMDFIASNGSTNAAGLTWTMTSANPRLSNYQMINSLTAPPSIEQPYTATPTTLAPYIGDLARKITQGSTSRFQTAVMLQDWFRDNFRYSLKTPVDGDSDQALLTFVTPGKGHRVGYCEQFAAAFAVMARTLDLPTRVAIGFLAPQKVGPDRYVYSAHDMHAWPEVYFRGSGWVRFEPTPALRTGNAPVYTTARVVKPGKKQSGGPSTKGGKTATDPSSASSHHPDLGQQQGGTGGGSHVPWLAILVALLVIGLICAIGLVPGAVRRARRHRRLEGGVEAAWAELRDSALDLGVGWPMSRSPHETGYLLSAWFGPEPDGAPLVRPPRGRGMAPGAEDALDRIVLTLERVRYARFADDVPGALADDVRTCITSLEHGCTRSALRRARWLPRSLFGKARRAAAQAELERAPEAVAAGGVVDHVG